ncbi:hypothetical protein P3T73_03825 [Kiritimatiellota bacterium B12222]|nr:hypothetical protein P3T73_03825 [Kiritimatiellota bacterium B12222]
MKSISVILVVWICFNLVRGQIPADFPVLIENAGDSSAGFTMLGKKMPPLPEGASPVKILITRGDWNYNYGDVLIPSVWGVQGPVPPQVLVTYTQIIDTDVRYIKENANGGYHFNFDPSDVTFTVEQVDVVENIRELFLLLLSTDDQQSWSRKKLALRYGDLMLYATRLHEAGYQDQANQLASYLFEKYSKRETVLRALSTLVDAEYMDILDAYQNNQDTPLFLTNAKTLLENNPSYWVSAPLLKEKIAQWESTALSAEALPASAQTLLSPELQELYRTLYTHSDALVALSDALMSENWYLQPNGYIEENYGFYEDEHRTGLKEAVEVLKQSRIDFLTLLEVMLSDPRLVPFLNEYGSESIDYEENGEVYELPEPMQMHSFAMEMLSGLAPNDEDWDVDDPEDQLRLLQNFKILTEGKNNLELAQYYLEHNNGFSLPLEASYIMLSSDRPEIRKQVLDQLFLDEEELKNNLMILKDYHRFQPAEAEQALAQALIALKLVHPDDAWEFGGEEGLEAEIAHIEKLLGKEAPVLQENPVDFELALDTWVTAGDPDDHEVIQSVLMSGKTLPSETLQLMVAKRVQENTIEIARTLLNFQAMIIHAGGVQGLQDLYMGQSSDQELMKYYVASHNNEAHLTPPTHSSTGVTWSKQAWMPLLERTKTPDQKRKAFVVAFNIVNSLQDHSEQTEAFYEFSQFFSGEANDADLLLINWAKGILTHPEDLDWLTEVPHAENVSPERLAEIRGLMLGDDHDAVTALFTSANFDDRLAALSLSTEEDTIAANETLWMKLKPLQKKVVLIQPNGLDPIIGDMQVGDSLSLHMISTALVRAQAEAQKGNSGILIFRTTPLFQGAMIYHTRDFISQAFFDEKGIQIHGISEDHRVSGTFDLESDLSLPPPQNGEPKVLNILEMIEADSNEQLENVSASIYAWLNSPTPPHQTQGQLLISYNGQEN